MIRNLQIYCLARPQDTFSYGNGEITRVLCAYRAGRGGTLLSLPAGGMQRGGLLGFDDRGLDPDGFDTVRFASRVAAECVLRGFDGIYAELTIPGIAKELVLELERQLIRRRGRLYLNEIAACYARSGRSVVSSEVTGGSFSRFLSEKCAEYGQGRLTLGLSRMRLDFTLPAANPGGMRISETTLARLIRQSGAQVFFSDELCANYFIYTDSAGTSHLTLFDNRRSLQKKLILAKDAGIGEAFVRAADLPLIL